MKSHRGFVSQTSLRLVLATLIGMTGIHALAEQAALRAELAGCVELKAEEIAHQTRTCSEHDGCLVILNSHKSCGDARQFLNKLQDAIGEGTKGFFGRRKEVTPDAVFDASLSAKTPAIDTLPGASDKAAAIRVQVNAASAKLLRGSAGEGKPWAYYGEIKDGKAEGLGTRFYYEGTAMRGTFKADRLHGSGDVILGGRNRYVAEFQDDKRNGLGVWVGDKGGTFVGEFEDNGMKEGKFKITSGIVYDGRFRDSQFHQGKMMRADDSLMAEGQFENWELSVGKHYEKDGSVTEVNKPRERELAAIAARESAERAKRAAEVERIAAEQRKSEEAARAAKAYRDKLDSMNAGQLFAMADELISQGELAKGKDVLRILISRFPDHKLADSAAEQLARGQRDERVKAEQAIAQHQADEQAARRTAEQLAQAKQRAAQLEAEQSRLDNERRIAAAKTRERELAQRRDNDRQETLEAFGKLLGAVVEAKIDRDNQSAAAAAQLVENQNQQRRAAQQRQVQFEQQQLQQQTALMEQQLARRESQQRADMAKAQQQSNEEALQRARQAQEGKMRYAEAQRERSALVKEQTDNHRQRVAAEAAQAEQQRLAQLRQQVRQQEEDQRAKQKAQDYHQAQVDNRLARTRAAEAEANNPNAATVELEPGKGCPKARITNRTSTAVLIITLDYVIDGDDGMGRPAQHGAELTHGYQPGERRVEHLGGVDCNSRPWTLPRLQITWKRGLGSWE